MRVKPTPKAPTLRLHITQDHIIDAKPRDLKHCMIADALRAVSNGSVCIRGSCNDPIYRSETAITVYLYDAAARTGPSSEVRSGETARYPFR